MNNRVFLLEDDEGVAAIAKLLEIKFGYQVDRARDLVDTVWYLEETNTKYLALLLDVAVKGEEFIDNKGNQRVFDDRIGMNGFEYYRQEREGILTQYKGRIGFYSAFTESIKSIAKKECISIDECMLFDKCNRNLSSAIHDWLKKLEDNIV